jgi:hypothetical protein
MARTYLKADKQQKTTNSLDKVKCFFASLFDLSIVDHLFGIYPFDFAAP